MQSAVAPVATSIAATIVPAPGSSRPSTGYARSRFEQTKSAPARIARCASAILAYVTCRSRPTTTVSGVGGRSSEARYRLIAPGSTSSAAASGGGGFRYALASRRDPDGADLLPQTVGPYRERPSPAERDAPVARGGVPARTIGRFATKPALLKRDIVEPVEVGFRREEHVPFRAPQPLERVARVGHDLRAAIEHAVHIEDRDRHEPRG